jgi:NTP pyrophosphatase (non-canonical NTP hydrolase)
MSGLDIANVMTFNVDHRLLQRAIEAWGPESRGHKTIEECAELINELCKLRGIRTSETAVAEEMADVYITLANLRMVIGPEVCDAALARKLAKFRGQVEAEQGTYPRVRGNGG